MKFETREGSVKEELERVRTLKKRVNVNFARLNKDNTVIVRKIVRASFSKRRKTLNNSLKKFLHDKNIDQALFSARSKEFGIDLSRRAETLSVNEFYKLTEITRAMFNK